VNAFVKLRRYSASIVLAAAFCPEAKCGLNASGPISGAAIWRLTDSPVTVVGNVSVPSGMSLTIEAGVVVRFGANTTITVQENGALAVFGTAQSRVSFLAEATGGKWGPINAGGANSALTIRHAELSGGGIQLGTDATALIEDSFIHDEPEAIVANSARFVTMRRIHVKNYAEVIFNSGTTILAEDSLFEGMSLANSDALEIQGGPSGSIIRRCTFRHSTGSNSDALDFNGTSGVFVHDCLIYDFSDKGISMGAAGAGGMSDRGIIVSNCCMYAVDTGVAVKDGSTCGLYNLTIANCKSGVRLYQKFTAPADGGHVTNSYNNIFWGNDVAIDLRNSSTLAATFSDFQGTNWAGTGNITVDPKFLDAASRDYHLALDSPCLATGKDGASMGARFPVGAPMAPSHPIVLGDFVAGAFHLQFWTDPEKNYTIISGSPVDQPSWPVAGALSAGAEPEFRDLTEPINEAIEFFRVAASTRSPAP
jgi:hypothetical protein